MREGKTLGALLVLLQYSAHVEDSNLIFRQTVLSFFKASGPHMSDSIAIIDKVDANTAA